MFCYNRFRFLTDYKNCSFYSLVIVNKFEDIPCMSINCQKSIALDTEFPFLDGDGQSLTTVF